MNRRELFRFLPGAAALAIPGAAAASAPANTEPGLWVEYDCPARFGWQENWEERTPCGTKFKTVRGAQPLCPKCGTTLQRTREQAIGIEVK
jgi:hypothetical protein